jgi:hypothetical protein
MAIKPKWEVLFDELSTPIINLGLDTIKKYTFADSNLVLPVYSALIHLGSCLEISTVANLRGIYSVSACLIRQCVESLTLIDIGLQREEFAKPLIEKWLSGKKTTGELRVLLESKVWSLYGKGLWNESWSEFFGQLARAVQPYAHYSQNLMLWQFKTDLDFQKIEDTVEGTTLYASMNPHIVDSQKDGQIMTLEALSVWTLGRLLLKNSKHPKVKFFESKISEWGESLGESEYIENNSNWSDNLLPIMYDHS